MKRWNRALMLALLTLAILACCAALPWRPLAREADEEPLYLIGLSQANLVEPWRVAMNLEFEAATAAHPELRVIYTDAAQDTGRQISDVEILMGYGIDLLVISPNDGTALAPAIAKAYAEIPVIVLDRAPEGYNF